MFVMEYITILAYIFSEIIQVALSSMIKASLVKTHSLLFPLSRHRYTRLVLRYSYPLARPS